MTQQKFASFDASTDVATLLFDQGGSYAAETMMHLYRQLIRNQRKMVFFTSELMALLVQREIAERK